MLVKVEADIILANNAGFSVVGGLSCLYIERVKKKLQKITRGAVFLIHGISVGVTFKSTNMQFFSWINIIVSDAARSTVILVRHVWLPIFLESHQRSKRIARKLLSTE